ncbi:MAG: zinc ribbon domain-containing protein YjdM [Bdellovibrionota bacterium]
MSDQTNCPKCQSESIYPEGDLWICMECDHEWTGSAEEGPIVEQTPQEEGIRDAFGAALRTGDSVVVIKDLKVKGSGSVVKIGTKVKNIRIVDSSDGHNVACKIDGIGAMNLKSEFVKKS